MRKIAVALSKGGVGKSTTAVSIAHGLALKKRRTLLIDTDDQGQCSWMLGVKPQYTLADVLSSNPDDQVDIQEAIFPARDNLWLLAGGSALSASKKDIGQKDFGAEYTLANALKPVEENFDYIIIDTSPSFDTLTVNAIFYCDEVLTPVSMEALALNSLIEFSKRMDSVKKYHTTLQHKYLLPTFKDGRVKKSSEIYSMLKNHHKGIVCEPIRYNVRLGETPAFGETIFEFDPRSPGAIDYKNLVKRIIRDEKTVNA